MSVPMPEAFSSRFARGFLGIKLEYAQDAATDAGRLARYGLLGLAAFYVLREVRS